MIEKLTQTTKLISALRDRAFHNAVLGERQPSPLSQLYKIPFWSTDNSSKNLRLLKGYGNRSCSPIMSGFATSEGEHILPDGFKVYTKTWNVRTPHSFGSVRDPIFHASHVSIGLSYYPKNVQYGGILDGYSALYARKSASQSITALFLFANALSCSINSATQGSLGLFKGFNGDD